MLYDPLPSLSAYADGITVSGLSSGGFMAGQFHVAYSDIVDGVGIFSAGPYLCSRGNLGTAVSKCTSSADSMDDEYIENLLLEAKSLEESGKIARLKNLKEDRVYIFHGGIDPTVKLNAAEKTKLWYQMAGVPEDRIKLKILQKAGHAFPTKDFGNLCESDTEPPWISNCGIDGAFDMMAHIYGNFNPQKHDSKGKLLEFDQTEFFGDKLNGMADKGYVYVPLQCKSEKCHIHIFFHGCQQGYNMVPQDRKNDNPEFDHPPYSKIRKTIVENIGLNEVAEANNIIVLYPQLKKTTKPFNPRGCYDFWGYVNNGGVDYATRDGEQSGTVYRMVRRLINK